MTKPSRIPVLGVGFDPLTLKGAVERISLVIEEKRRIRNAAADSGAFTVITANPEFVQAALKDDILREASAAAGLVLPDGIGILWAGRILGRPFPERVAGADLAEALLDEGSRQGWRFYFLGGRPSISEAAAANALKRFPGIEIAGTMHGYFEQCEEERVIAGINASRADVLLAGLGAPKQEKWLWRNRQRLGAAVSIGVGGTLDVLAGAVKRAPAAFRRAGLEWLYRLLTQPSRAGRMLNLPVFAFNIVMARLFWRDACERAD